MSVSHCKRVVEIPHLFSPLLKVFKLAMSARILVGVSFELIARDVFKDEDDETFRLKDTL